MKPTLLLTKTSVQMFPATLTEQRALGLQEVRAEDQRRVPLTIMTATEQKDRPRCAGLWMTKIISADREGEVGGSKELETSTKLRIELYRLTRRVRCK